MGFFRSSCSITRFSIIESVSKGLLVNIKENLQKYAFRDIDNTLEERAWGWTNIDDMLDTSWSISPPEKGEYIAFALRLETRRIPPGVLKKHLGIALNNEKIDLQKIKGKGISQERRHALHDMVHNRLLKRFLPIPAIFDVAWNTHINTVYLASIDTKIICLFSNFFTTTFNVQLIQQNPYNLASSVYDKASIKLEQLVPTPFV